MSEKACVKCVLVDGETPFWYGYAQIGIPLPPARAEASRRWRPAVGHHKCRVIMLVGGDEERVAMGQHLDVTCAGCGYTYAEPCRDAKP